MRPLLKILSPEEQLKLDRLKAQAESRVRRALERFLRAVTSELVLRRILRLLEVGDTEGVLRIIDESIVDTSGVLSDVFIDAAKDVTVDVLEQLADQVPTPLVGIAFDPNHPEATRLMEQNRLEFIRGFTEQQREATRAALAQALRTGAGPLETARIIRASLGLTEHQELAVLNYRRLLELGLREALERDLRDRRFDRTIQRAIGAEVPLTQQQIDRMVDRYRQRFLAYRSEVIARTETTKIMSQARHLAVLQVMQQAGITDNQVKRSWVTNLDGRERPSHHEMDGQEVTGMNSYYTSPSGARLKYPGDPEAPAGEIIQCRCAETFRFSY